MASHNICSKTDRALAAYLISVGAGTSADIYPAKLSENKALPDTICFSSRARLMTANSGVYVVMAIVQVRTDPSVDVDQTAVEKKTASEDRVGPTFDAFWIDVDSSNDKLAAAITDAARASVAPADGDLQEFTVQDCSVTDQTAGFDARGNGWMDTIELELVVCPSNVS